MEASSDKQSGPEHLLITVLGTRLKEATYLLGNRPGTARVAPVALFNLLPQDERPDRVLALCTELAKAESLPYLKAELAHKCPVQCVEVPAGDAQGDVDAFLTQVARAIPESTEVTLTVDITHGFRHFSFLIYVAVLYLQALRGTRVRAAYYGILGPDAEPRPFLDLRPLLDLPDWIYALRALRDTGSAAPIAKQLDASASGANRKLVDGLRSISEAYLAGLPLELGQQVEEFERSSLKPLRRSLKQLGLPAAKSLAEHVKDTLAPFRFNQAHPSQSKTEVALTKAELMREARFIDALIEQRNLPAALGLMNEWTVSWAILNLDTHSSWLDYGQVRRQAAQKLGAIRAIGDDRDLCRYLNEQQSHLGKFWGTLSNLRNGFHHHGMRPQKLIGDKKVRKELDSIHQYWAETLRDCSPIDLSIGGTGGSRVLISPIGTRPGVLYSALLACRDESREGMPDCCLVLCSAATEQQIDEAARQANFDGKVERLTFNDPYGGNEEIKIMKKKAKPLLIGTGQVFVNVTGGTTLMGLAADALADAARQLACPVRRFGLIDRRTPQEQDRHPYRNGQAYWLDATDPLNNAG